MMEHCCLLRCVPGLSICHMFVYTSVEGHIHVYIRSCRSVPQIGPQLKHKASPHQVIPRYYHTKCIESRSLLSTHTHIKRRSLSLTDSDDGVGRIPHGKMFRFLGFHVRITYLITLLRNEKGRPQ
jgi:hypothetical protein